MPIKNKLPYDPRRAGYPGQGNIPILGGVPPFIFTGGRPQYPGGPAGTPPFVDPRMYPPILNRGPRPNTDPGVFQVGTPAPGASAPPLMPPPNPDQNRVITPAEAAAIPADTSASRYNPDLAPPGVPPPFGPQVGQPVPPQPPRGGIGGFFNKLTATPTAESLYTAGSILAGAPQPNESPLQQAVRAVGGAMSTRGAYAQMQAAQAEARRKADLELREQMRKEADTTGLNADRARQERQADIEADLKARQARETERHNIEAEKPELMNAESLKAYREKEAKKIDSDIAKADADIKLDERKLKNLIAEQASENARDLLRIGIDKKKNEIEWYRAKAYAMSVRSQAEMFRNLKYWDRAVDIAKASEGLSDLKMTGVQKYQKIQGIMDDLEKYDARGGKGPVTNTTTVTTTNTVEATKAKPKLFKDEAGQIWADYGDGKGPVPPRK
jgi:hypothetical protein